MDKIQVTLPGNDSVDVYPFLRDESEKTRLNLQHFVFANWARGLVHVDQPLEELETVADVGTGTGIWLHDLANRLSVIPSKSGIPRQLHGFDISAAQMPLSHNERHHFHIHDMNKPFPLEFQKKFDFVHIRLLIAALKEAEISAVLENVLALLKPGGRLQWEDLDFTNSFGENMDSKVYPPLKKYIRDMFRSRGITLSLPPALMSLLCAHRSVAWAKVHRQRSVDRTDLKDELNMNHFSAIYRLLDAAMKEGTAPQDLDLEKSVKELMSEFKGKSLLFVDELYIMTCQVQS